MADNWASWYSGSMAPPNRLPDGSYVAAPSVSSPMTVEEMYRGIYGPSSGGGLTTRQVQTVQIDPYTGNPVVPTISASAKYGGAGVRINSSMTPSPATINASAGVGVGARASGGGTMKVYPNQPNGSLNFFKSQDRLPAQPAGLSVGKAGVTASAKGTAGAMGSGSGTLSLASNSSPASAAPTGTLDLPWQLSDVAGQNTANSRGAPVRDSTGKIFYPRNITTDKIRAPMGPVPAPAPAQRPGLIDVLMGNTQPRQGGLLSLFMGGDSGRGSLGGLLGGMSSGPSSFGSSPSQSLAMTVQPGTQTGSTLSSMGFSDGAAVPAATIRSLSERGYI